MTFSIPKNDFDASMRRMEEMERKFWARKYRIEGIRATSGLNWVASFDRPRGGYQVTPEHQQRVALNKCFEVLGDDIWNYGRSSGSRNNKFQEVKRKVEEALNTEIDAQKLRRWMQYYIQYGEIPGKRKKRRRRNNQTKTFTEDDDDTLLAIITRSPQLFLDEISQELTRLRGKTWSDSSIWRRLHRLGYSLQVAIFRARQAQEEEQELFYTRLEQNVSRVEQIIIIDETHKSKSASRRRRAWGLRGQTPVLPTYFSEHFKKTYTMIGAANINGFILSACEVVERDRSESRGTIDTLRFERYIEECIVPILGNFSLSEPNSIVIMDNVIMHLSDKVSQLIHDAGALLILTAPYSPHLNPIEYFFSTYKAALARHSYQAEGDWFHCHWKALQEVTPASALNTFRHCKFPGVEAYVRKQQEKEETENLVVALVAMGVVLYSYGRNR